MLKKLFDEFLIIPIFQKVLISTIRHGIFSWIIDTGTSLNREMYLRFRGYAHRLSLVAISIELPTCFKKYNRQGIKYIIDRFA